MFYPMKIDSDDLELVSIDEERTTGRVARQVDLANNVQARYSSQVSIDERLSDDHEESKILFEISLGLRC